MSSKIQEYIKTNPKDTDTLFIMQKNIQGLLNRINLSADIFRKAQKPMLFGEYRMDGSMLALTPGAKQNFREARAKQAEQNKRDQEKFEAKYKNNI